MVRFLFITILLALHPVHVSLMSIDYESERKTFGMFIMVYYDDFLLDLGIDTADVKESDFYGKDQLSKKLLSDYVNDKVRVTVNKKAVRADLEDTNLADNELRMYFSFASPGRTRSITVKSNIMTSIYNDQANMIIVKVNDFEEGARLTADEPEKIFLIE